MNNLKIKLRNNLIYNSIKKNKIFKNKFNNEVQGLYTESYKTLLKEIKEDLNKLKRHQMFMIWQLILM